VQTNESLYGQKKWNLLKTFQHDMHTQSKADIEIQPYKAFNPPPLKKPEKHLEHLCVPDWVLKAQERMRRNQSQVLLKVNFKEAETLEQEFKQMQVIREQLGKEMRRNHFMA